MATHRHYHQTGRRALYVNELMSALIDGYSEGESRDIIEALNAHVKSADVIYEHKCRGDLMMWDNWCTMHARTDFPGPDPHAAALHDFRPETQRLNVSQETDPGGSAALEPTSKSSSAVQLIGLLPIIFGWPYAVSV